MSEPEYATFYALLTDVEQTKAEHERYQTLLARANRRGGRFGTADWRALYRATAEYEAALALMAAFVARMDAMPGEPEAEAA